MLSKVSLSIATLAIVLSGLAIDPALATTASQLVRARPSTSSQNATLVASGLGFTVRGVRPSRSRTGGISRGGTCGVEGEPVQLTALLPINNQADQSNNAIAIESTIVDRPSFFVFVPRTIARSAQFLLLNEAGTEVVYEITFELPTTPGVVGLKLPDDAPPLAIGQQYQWSLSAICDPIDRAGDLVAEGWIERIAVPAALSRALAQAAPRDRPALYANAGIWQDTLSELAVLRYANPDDPELQADWASLLESVGLTTIANQPLLPMVAVPVQPNAVPPS